jgi:hypothetical protein
MASTRATWRSSTVGPGYFFSQLAAAAGLAFGGGLDKGLRLT